MDAEPARTQEEAYALLCDTMNEVEDEFSGVIYDPMNFLNDGRFYPPQRDARRSVAGRPDLVRYRSRGHNTFISEDGAIRIQSVPKARQETVVILDKPGHNGKKVEL